MIFRAMRDTEKFVQEMLNKLEPAVALARSTFRSRT